jgi:ATP-dependent RNA helicase RhlE
MPFDHLGLRAELLKAVATLGYSEPTPIQDQAIPVILAGEDLLAGAQTGTGKTAAFSLPMVQLLAEQPEGAWGEKRRRPRALVLVPTRELAAQVGQELQNFGRRLSLRSAVLYGGVTIDGQIARLRNGVDMVVATPGRLLDHVERGTVNLSRVEFLVLDEADRMLDLGFIDDILQVAAHIPRKPQTLLFSATYSDTVRRLADQLLHQPRRVEVASRTLAADQVAQTVYRVEQDRKRELLSHLISSQKWSQALVFTRTRYGADKLTEQLQRDGITAVAIHSSKSQSLRTRTLAQFKEGAVRVLVATDVAARGLDIALLPCVVNYDMPFAPEDYVHRIGRTGRAGADGIALSLVAPEEQPMLTAIEQLLHTRIPVQRVPGFTLFALRPTPRPKDDARPKTPPKPKKAKGKKGVVHRPKKTGGRGRRG